MLEARDWTAPVGADHGEDRYKTAQVYSRLKRFLIFQSVPPRTKLDIGVLSRRLHVSKTPVREALIMLAEERIIRAEPGRGYFSKPLNAKEIAEDYEVAFAMLKYAIETNIDQFSTKGLVAPKPDPLAAVGQNLAHNVRPYADFIESIFETIAGTAKNSLCFQIIQAFNGRTSFIRELDLQQPGRLEQIAGAMSEFIELLERRDVHAAITNLERQFKEKLERLHHLVDQGQLLAMNASDSWQDLLH